MVSVGLLSSRVLTARRHLALPWALGCCICTTTIVHMLFVCVTRWHGLADPPLQAKRTYPLLRLSRRTLLPHTTMHVSVGKLDSVALIEDCLEAGEARDIGAYVARPHPLTSIVFGKPCSTCYYRPSFAGSGRCQRQLRCSLRFPGTHTKCCRYKRVCLGKRRGSRGFLVQRPGACCGRTQWSARSWTTKPTSTRYHFLFQRPSVCPRVACTQRGA